MLGDLRRWAGALLALILLAGAPGAAGAAEAKVAVEGFRSARFGMDEKALRAAIAQDFKVKPESVRAEDNPVERTRALVVEVAELLPGAGPAQLAYLLGYQSKALFQVNVVWNVGNEGEAGARRLVSTANLLVGHFQAAGYRPDTIAVNALRPDGGVVVFRGADAQGRTTQLLLLGTATTGADGKPGLTPQVLHLSYTLNPDAPDVFRIKPGQF